MLTVAAADIDRVRPFFSPERPGPAVFGHVSITGHGKVEVDRWPDPRVATATVGQNVSIRGDPAYLPPDALDGVAAFLEAPRNWEEALHRADPSLAVWKRVVAELPNAVTIVASGAGLLGPDDAAALAALPADIAWIHATWGGPDGLANAGVARGCRVAGQLVAVAVPFLIGLRFEDVGVVTVETHRGHGMALSCASAVLADIRGRGHVPSWSTSPDNAGSLAVAARLGFVQDREDVLYAMNVPIPH